MAQHPRSRLPARRPQGLPDDDRPQPVRPGLRRDLVDRAACPNTPRRPPFPTEGAVEHQLAAIARMATDETRIAPDEALAAEALAGVCSIPLSRRAYDALRTDPAATALPDWMPANFAGPNGSKVFTRRSGDTLRTGIDGLFTYAGFHDVVLARLEDVAAQAELDRSVFAGGCEESSGISVDALAEDVLKLYYDDFIAQWDALLRDLTLAPITDLAVASENLKDLANPELGAAPPADRDRRRDRPCAAGRRRSRRRRAAEGHLQGPRQAGQARQARQEGAEVRAHRRRGARHLRPAGLRSLQGAARHGAGGRRRAAGARRRRGGAGRALEHAADRAGEPQPRAGDQGPGRPRRADRRRRQPGGADARPARRLARRHRRHQRHHREGGRRPAQRGLARRRAALLQGGARRALSLRPGQRGRRQHGGLRPGLRARRADRRLHQRPAAALRRHRVSALAAGGPTSASTPARWRRSSRPAASATGCSPAGPVRS